MIDTDDTIKVIFFIINRIYLKFVKKESIIIIVILFNILNN
jgi:hypothetical protein